MSQNNKKTPNIQGVVDNNQHGSETSKNEKGCILDRFSKRTLSIFFGGLSILIVAIIIVLVCVLHKHQGGKATCTEWGACARCNKNYLEPLSHSFDDGDSKTCNACGKIISEGLEYILLDDGTYSVIGIGTCAETDIAIPEKYNEKPVTAIGESAFKNCSSIKYITIPKSIINIGNSAFEHCDGLTFASIPEGVTSIGENAFKGCKNLVKISIPDSIRDISNGAFLDCESLRYNKYSNALYLGNENNPYLCLIKAKNAYITSCKIHNDTKLIYHNAFYYCTLLGSIKIPEGVIGIGDYAFVSCDCLKLIDVPSTVTSIGNSAFADIFCLKSVTIGNGVTSIGTGAFKNCTRLKTITIPFVGATKDGTNNTHFGYIFGAPSYTNNADYVPSSLETVTITGGTNIGSSAFYDCTSLKSLYITDLKAWCEIDFGDYVSNPLYYARNLYLNGELVTELVVPDEITTINDLALSYFISLKSITIPDSITSIGDYAFSSCTSLSSINVSSNNENYKSVDGNLYSKDGTTLIQYAIGKTDSSFIIPDSVTSIDSSTFWGCKNLTSVTISNSVTSIGNASFYDCKNLTSIIFNGTVSEWNSVNKDALWNYYVPATEVICSDGVVEI